MFSFFKKKISEGFTNKIELILAEATPYGSRVWGGSTKKSDYDYICTFQQYADIRNACYYYDVDYKHTEDYNDSIRYNILVTVKADKVYQLLVPYSSDLSNYQSAVAAMDSYSSIYDMSSKKLRHSTFTSFYKFFVESKVLPDKLRLHLEEHSPELLI